MSLLNLTRLLVLALTCTISQNECQSQIIVKGHLTHDSAIRIEPMLLLKMWINDQGFSFNTSQYQAPSIPERLGANWLEVIYQELDTRYQEKILK